MRQSNNVKRLIIQKMSADAVPKNGGMKDAIKFLSSKESILAGARAATIWVEAAILAVRQASEPNPWKNADDEVIAGEILKRLKEKGR